MAARKSAKPSKKGLSESTLALLASVKAATSIQKGSSLSDRQSHCRFFNGFVVATNDVMIIGVPVTGLSIDCCPHSKTLIAAIERCEGEIAFSLDGQVLTVKSGRVRVPVPCLPADALIDLYPDAWQGSAAPALAQALGTVAQIVNDASDRIICRAVYMTGSVVEGSRDGHYGVQVWHGIDPLPTVALPKESALSVAKYPAELTGIGTGPGCATFWFSNNAFIRTRLIDIKAPDFNRILECKTNKEPVAIGADFFHAIRTVLPFSKDRAGLPSETVTFADGKVWAGEAHEGNASIDYPESPLADCAFNGEYLLTIEMLASSVIHDEFERRLYFSTDNVRGVLMGLSNNDSQRG